MHPPQVVVLRRTTRPLGLNKAKEPEMSHEVGVGPAAGGDIKECGGDRIERPKPSGGNSDNRDGHQQECQG